MKYEEINSQKEIQANPSQDQLAAMFSCPACGQMRF